MEPICYCQTSVAIVTIVTIGCRPYRTVSLFSYYVVLHENLEIQLITGNCVSCNLM